MCHSGFMDALTVLTGAERNQRSSIFILNNKFTTGLVV